MALKITENWQHILKDEFEKNYFKALMDFVTKEYEENICYPKKKDIFAAFNYCDFEDLKVVIIGQDPYHGEGQANGLCFSVNKEIQPPPSLINIFKELQDDLNTVSPESGDLSFWAKQGVLLLNATLTVRKGAAGSHQKQGWEQFTDAVISKISKERENIVFLLWGGFAKKKGAKISAQKHFSKTNSFLKSKGLIPVDWI